MNTICVVGLGYIGLPTASLFANNGYKVLGVDTNLKVVETINAGEIHINEVGLRTLVEAAVRSGHLMAATSPNKADVYIIAVPTPFGSEKQPDLSFVFDSVKEIIPFLEPGNLVILESTIPPGTTKKVARFIAGQRPDLIKEGKRFDESLKILIAHCPERVLPGQILKELVGNDRVVGGLDELSGKRAEGLYGSIVSGSIYRTDATTAEMVKLSENTFRDVNISLSNELALICQKLGVNIWEIISLANKHPRVKFLNPGPGVGGHCIAVDPWFIVSEFPEDAKVIRSARDRNDMMPGAVARQTFDLLRNESNPKVACLGGSYKANVGDSRNSPAIEVYRLLQEKFGDSATIELNDMYIVDSSLPLKPLDAVLSHATLILLLVDHDDYKLLDPVVVGRVVSRKRVFDTRNTLDRKKWEAAGFDVHVLGDGSKPLL
jgi:UDP-N-acetyl-D-mannosaminuronic acid dehydrogenase